MRRGPFGTNGLDELTGASERVRTASILSGNVAQARVNVLARHKPQRLRKHIAEPQSVRAREGGYEIRKARLNLYRRGPIVMVLALLLTGDSALESRKLTAGSVCAGSSMTTVLISTETQSSEAFDRLPTRARTACSPVPTKTAITGR